MLHPVFLKDEVYQQMLRYHAARNVLVSQWTQIINQIRGFAKSKGDRIEDCSTERFHELNRSAWSRDLDDAAWPLIGVLKAVNLKIRAYDKQIVRLMQRPEFKDMVPRQDQSGDSDKQLHMTKAGSAIVRKALTERAGGALMSNAKETDVKLKGLRIDMHGGKIARKKAKMAVTNKRETSLASF